MVAAFVVVSLVAGVVALSGCQDKRRHQTSAAVGVADVEPPVAADASPSEVARAFLSALREAQESRQGGLGAADKIRRYDLAMGKARSLAAGNIIHRELLATPSVTIPKDVSEEAALTLAAESWVSIVAHYADGFLFETLGVRPANLEGAESAIVEIEAERVEEAERLRALESSPGITGARDAEGRPISPGTSAYRDLVRSKAWSLDPPLSIPIRAKIQIQLRRDDGAWRIARMDIGPGTLPPMLASPPASSPTTRPAHATLGAR